MSRLRVVSVGDRRSANRLMDAVCLAADDCGVDGPTSTRIARRTLELLRDDGLVLTRQVKA